MTEKLPSLPAGTKIRSYAEVRAEEIREAANAKAVHEFELARGFDEIVINGMKVDREACQRYMREWQDKVGGELAEPEPDTHDEWRGLNE